MICQTHLQLESSVETSTNMADATATTMSGISLMQSALTVLNAMSLTEFRYPPNCTLTEKRYDHIIIGGGTAGCVLAYRLSADPNNQVLLIEEGGYPPFESEIPGFFTPMPKTDVDYDILSENDKYTTQNLNGSVVSLTLGKMLGGSSNIGHMIHVHGDPHDYNHWAESVGDDRWKYKNVLPYFIKSEKMDDRNLAATPFADLHGTDGMVKIEREIDPVNSLYLDAFAQIGHNVVEDTTSTESSLGANSPFFTIGDNLRQSSSITYLSAAKSRSNLCVALTTKATKILIENNEAVGVEVTTAGGKTLKVYANKEVIVSAGAIHSPQLLMLSGIGPKEHLESLGIPIVADLPVGQNFMDHPSAVLVIQMEKNNEPTPAGNPYIFPVPTTTLYAALNSSQTYPDYQTINLVFPHDSGALMQLCANCFKYSNKICNAFNAANVGRTVLFVVHNLLMPKSRGSVTLSSTDPKVEPTVKMGYYSNSDDLDLMVDSLIDFVKVLDTDYFKKANATLVDTNLCTGKTGKDFWKCYALGMSSTMWHYAGTCAMGSVTDAELRVKGVKNLRVADASVMPTEVSGNINAAVTMIGEVAAALILGTA